MHLIIPWWILPLLSLLTVPPLISHWIVYSRVLIVSGKNEAEARKSIFGQLMSMRMLPAALSMVIGAMFAFPHGTPVDMVLSVSGLGIAIGGLWTELTLWQNSGIDIDPKIESSKGDTTQKQQKTDQRVTIRMKPWRYDLLALYVLEFIGFLIGRTFGAT